MKYVADKDKKKFAEDFKTTYQAPNETLANERMLEITEKWEGFYPNAMKSWSSNWDVNKPNF